MPETLESEVVQPEQSKSVTKRLKAQKGNGQESESAMVPRGDVDMLMVEAVRSGNIEVMERVMAIRRELKAEAAKEAFFSAMAAFRSECPVIKRTKPVWNKEHTRIMYHYAPLDQIEKVVGPIIARYGLSYSFKAHIERPTSADQETDLVMECYVNHEAGHVEVSPFRLPISGDYMNRNQQRGNTNSYAKRYAFCNAFGVMSEDEDDDSSDYGRISPQDARKARQPVSQPRQTPTAQKAAQAANGAQTGRVQLEPAGEGEVIDANTLNGLTKAMEHGALGISDFKKRFPNLNGLEQVKKADARVVIAWIGAPMER